MNTLDALKNEFGFTDEELDYALDRAKGIILGFAMEYRAKKVLEQMNFRNIQFVNLPTHDLEAEKDGIKYYIEVKATKKSPTREYSAYKIAMMAKLDGVHMTLIMIPKPNLLPTEEVLSKPKRILYEFFKLVFRGDLEKLKEFLSDESNRIIISSYDKVINYYVGNKESFKIVESVL